MTTSTTRRSVIFAGGGTGGHLFPGIAVARELLVREPAARVLFVGSQKPIEPEIVIGAGFEHVALPSVSPSLRPARIVSSLLSNWRAYRQAREVIARERPSVVVGLGGFASVPPVLAAWRAGVPIVLLEQNVVPGKATRWLSRFASVVCLPWPQAAIGLPRGVKTVVTGNPIRAEIASLGKGGPASEKLGAEGIGNLSETSSPSLGTDEDSASQRSFRCDAHSLKQAVPPIGSGRESTSTMLILGGSQGATSLNAAVLDAIATLRAELTDWRIVHQTGAADLDTIRQRYAELSVTADVQPFVRNMAEQYRRATCVISRAGATTLAELACAGLPALLVPLPTSAHDHQRLNARLFADQSAALVVEPTDSLPAAIRQLLGDASLRVQLSQNLRVLARPHAGQAVADVICG